VTSRFVSAIKTKSRASPPKNRDEIGSLHAPIDASRLFAPA